MIEAVHSLLQLQDYEKVLDKVFSQDYQISSVQNLGISPFVLLYSVLQEKIQDKLAQIFAKTLLNLLENQANMIKSENLVFVKQYSVQDKKKFLSKCQSDTEKLLVKISKDNNAKTDILYQDTKEYSVSNTFLGLNIAVRGFLANSFQKDKSLLDLSSSTFLPEYF